MDTPVEEGGRWQAPLPMLLPELPLERAACHRPLSPAEPNYAYRNGIDYKGLSLRGALISEYLL
jgi:hypothetical protein